MFDKLDFEDEFEDDFEEDLVKSDNITDEAIGELSSLFWLKRFEIDQYHDLQDMYYILNSIDWYHDFDTKLQEFLILFEKSSTKVQSLLQGKIAQFTSRKAYFF